MAQIATIGLWHLGCVVSAGLASLGHTVRSTDPDAATVRNLQQGKLPIHEPGLPELTAERLQAGRLGYVETVQEAVQGADFIFVTFDTPVDENDRSDIGLLEAAIEQIAWHADDRATIVVMSQVPVGSCDRFVQQLRRNAPDASFSLVCQPENLRLGEAISTFLRPDFMVLGAEDEEAASRVLKLYETIEAPKLVMSRNSAEMTKHGLNAFLATSISFANELSDLTEICGANIQDVVCALRMDRRIGKYAFLSPGPGFSGGTLGRDLRTLQRVGAGRNRKTRQIDATIEVNESRIGGLIEKIERECGDLSGLRVGLLGLTYKPGTNTLRRSRALELAERMMLAGASVQAFDPQVTYAGKETRGIVLCADAYRAVEGADVVVLMTPWPEFKRLDLARLRQSMHRPVLIDVHNHLDARAARAAGFLYFGVGIPAQAEELREAVHGGR